MSKARLAAVSDRTRKSGDGDGDLAAILARRLQASLLPGESAIEPEELAGAARFLLAAADGRAPGESAVVIESVGAASRARFMRIALVNDDMPFLVDSVAATITAHGLAIDRLMHPVVPVVRDADRHVVGFGDDGARESMIYIETRRADARARAALAAELDVVLADVRAAVADWPRMRECMDRDARRLVRLGRPEGAALLRWFEQGMLTQLGHVVRRRNGRQDAGLGICRASAGHVLSADSYARAFAWFDAQAAADDGVERLPLIIKANRIAHVHRRVPLDLFLLPIVERGKVRALSVHAGVWTSAALATPPDRVPRLREQLAALMARYGFDPVGHAGKKLVHALTNLPHDLLTAFADADLERVAMTMMSLLDRPRPKLVMVEAPLERHLFAFVWLPRELVSTTTRLEVASMLTAAAGADVLDWSLEVEGSNLAQLLFTLDLREREGPRDWDEDALDARFQAMVRGWGDAVEAELAQSEEPSRAAAIAARYADAFPLAYRTAYGAAQAATDIAHLRHLSTDDGHRRGARLHAMAGDGPGHLRLKIYQRGGALVLSDVVPALENFGFRVIDNVPTELAAEGETASIHDFLLALPGALTTAEVFRHAPMIEDALSAVLNAAAEDDPFNRLIVTVGLSAREANWLRAWYRYLRQAGMSFGVVTTVDALTVAPQVALGLIDLFRARHQPGLDDGERRAEDAETAIRDALARVSAINDDRLLRAFRAVVLAVLRTNAFAPAGETALAFKLDSALVPGLPRPVPWREIFVYSARVEGIHLRAGPVARGGLRWSDRRDDFRTEILGLMKAQRVKNAVIVPTGAKGGFYPKRLPDPARDREGWAAEGRASYQVFIRTLLSVTDNIVGGSVVHPQGVTIRDGEDPYFVVAADKGTATFSDTANAIAEEFGFWLDDAFASGGSKGYDHKAMGITARGAWLSVQRHFLELGVDVQADPVRVVGCGDMSGDVFGNGMLLSKTLKVVAAFDHRHVFLDPDPDPAASWAERARLFALPRSSWDDYDKALISAGGGVFARSQKEIPLSPEVQAALGLNQPVIDPEGLITAILKAPVDLLWFGGIGTYVKAAGENNATVGDPANDAIRVDGREVRARVIGEGANLGCTQAGRIEFALLGANGKGGRNNTDFIDNSAGVDCSDKEVNIKIALASARRAGRLTEPGRVKLLQRMTDDVAALVLEDNRLQALALSIAEAGGASAVGSQARLIEMLEDAGQLDRRTEGLADADALARRGAEGRGLTRPELAVLLSSAKLAIQQELEESTVPDDPGLIGDLVAAFPPSMQKRFRQDILDHRLRREIIATRLANRIVNRLGCVHPFELAEEEGVGLADVVAAFVAAETLFGMSAVWRVAEAEPMPEAARIALFTAAAQGLRTHMADLLRAGAANTAPSRLAAELAPGVTALADSAQDLLASEARAQSLRIRDGFIAAGAPAGEAAAVTHLFDLDGAIGLARLARDSGVPAPALAQGFIELGAGLGLDWAQASAVRLSPSDPWERLLVAGLARDFQQMRLDFLRRAGGGTRKSDRGRPGGDARGAVQAWLGEHDAGVRRFRDMVGRARLVPQVSPAMLAQIASQARNLLAR
ncbi:MAG: NAD-glutamate dehydrogenase [Sphingomonadales bacterium]|nr:NAD-glutamate dehydrogenase [Sphingomonadales bacterium]